MIHRLLWFLPVVFCACHSGTNITFETSKLKYEITSVGKNKHFETFAFNTKLF